VLRFNLGTAHDEILRVCACDKSYAFDLCLLVLESTKVRRFTRVMGSIRVHSLQDHRAKSARGAALKCTVFPGATTEHAMISWLRRIYEFVMLEIFLKKKKAFGLERAGDEATVAWLLLQCAW
jgi:hypothetical protein